MVSELEKIAGMGPLLRAEVDKQLIEDLKNYGIQGKYFTIDWANPCEEGHCTDFLDGSLEESSDIGVLDETGNMIAEGWIDFIHGGDSNPLFVFWLFLSIKKGENWLHVKKEPTIPIHVWNKLPEKTKQLCTTEGKYDARWHKDPLVQKWKREIMGN